MIYIFGDVHAHFQHVLDIVHRDRPDAIIFLGDLECQRPLDLLVAEIRDLTDIWFIHGNHDTDDAKVYRNLFENRFADRNLHGRIVEIAGVRVAGLGGIFRADIWYPPEDPKHFEYAEWASVQKMKQGQRRRLTKMDLCQLQSVPTSTAEIQDLALDGKLRKHRSSIFYRDYERLYGQRADILVTHEAQSCHRHGFVPIDELAQSLGVKASFHGHHHDSLDYRQFDEQFGFRAYGVGFCGVVDQDGKMIQPGNFDEARQYRQSHPVEVSQRPNATFTFEFAAGHLLLVGDEAHLDLDLAALQPGAAATQILDFLSGYHRVMIFRDNEVAEVQFLALLGKRAPAHISFAPRKSK